ncbi:MAG: hypothetical protein HY362_01200, partial [Candidatus Aenigmarchaeota archaeon]|nr:hypothetical protein [Candidatus Aenigmarchaeota archaeon]
MNKLFCIVAATLFLLTIPTISFAFSTDNQWTYLVVHSDTNTREYTNRWFDLAYNDNWWTPITGDGIKPVYTSGSNAVLLRKTINWNGEDLWFRGWEGYAGTCYINQIKVDSQHIHLSDYLKTGNNLVACSIWGKGVTYWENRQAYFYGQFIPVSENQLAWSNSNDWARWFVNNRPINTGTEAKFYFCYDNPQESYGCFLNSAWPWNKDKGVSGTAFTKSFYLESPEEKNIVIGANVMVSGGQYCWNNGQCWPTAYCNFNGQLIGFYPNTHEKYNYKAAVSGKAGINTITCYVPTIKEPNPVNNWSSTGYNKFDLALAPALEILELTEYSVSSEDPTITILVNGAGNATVYAELFENGKSVSVPIEDTLDLNGQTEVPLTLEVNNTGKYSVKITAVYNEYGISKSKDYNLEITETPIVLPITGNPFVQDSGGGSNSAGTDSSSSAIPLAAGLAGVAAVGVGYAALRNSNNR